MTGWQSTLESHDGRETTIGPNTHYGVSGQRKFTIASRRSQPGKQNHCSRAAGKAWDRV